VELVHGRKISGGTAEGVALVSHEPISFFGGVNPDTGVVTEKGHELEGASVKDRVLVFPYGKGSTVGSYTLYRMKRNGVAPLAIINVECEPIVAVGAIISDIPTIDKLEKDPLSFLRNGMKLRVDGDGSSVEVTAKPAD
jgi:predicted aconitase with swiveling domain